MTLFEKLQKRLSNTPEQIEKIIYILEKYNLRINIRCFDQYGLVLFDERRKTVRIVFGEKGQTLIKIEPFYADIGIIYIGELLAGWIEKSKIEIDGSLWFIDPQTLHKMPKEFLFKQECPHMDIYGGLSDGEYWECLGCGERLVFSENI
jgi:hypothetical protein